MSREHNRKQSTYFAPRAFIAGNFVSGETLFLYSLMHSQMENGKNQKSWQSARRPDVRQSWSGYWCPFTGFTFTNANKRDIFSEKKAEQNCYWKYLRDSHFNSMPQAPASTCIVYFRMVFSSSYLYGQRSAVHSNDICKKYHGNAAATSDTCILMTFGQKQENCAYARVAPTANTCGRAYSFKKHLEIEIITISIAFDLGQSSPLAGSKIDPIIIVIMFARKMGKIKIRSG